ncbi:PQQ-binding-like beta-propeller repeat protein [Methanomethylovorans sp.]|uniref:outer membrane protein assembly factor BamB family protein n=1 Tax=Methanomethylovorans sp. TaxID=2758717 RepID=UPI00345E06D4
MGIKTVALLVVFLLILIIVPAEAADWTMSQADIYHSGITSDRAPTTIPNVSFSWEYRLNDGVITSPLAVNDLVYVVSSDNMITALNVSIGEEIWQVSSSGNGAIGSPAYGDGQLFVATGDGYIYSFDAATGGSIWSEQVISGVVSTPVVYYNKKVYFGAGSVYYCYSNSGALEWSRSSPHGATYDGAGAVVIGNHVVYGDNSGHLVSLETGHGTLVDDIDGQEAADIYGTSVSSIRSSVVYDSKHQRIYFTSDDGTCYYLGFNSASGTFDTSDAGKNNVFTSTEASTVIYNNRIYITGESSGAYFLRCLDADDLSIVWSLPVSEKIVHSPVLSSFNDAVDGEVFVYFGTVPGKIYCIKDKDGRSSPSEQWSYSKHDVTSVPSELVISSGKVLFGTTSGYLVALGTTQKPVADFSAYPKMGVVPMTVSFTDKSSDATAWEWDVDNDGDVDYTTKSCQHKYEYVGKYTVKLKVTNIFGEDIEIKTDYIVVNAQGSPSGEMGGYARQNNITSSAVHEEEEVFVVDMGAKASPNINIGKDEISVEDVSSESDTNKRALGYTGIESLLLLLISVYYMKNKK